MLQVVLDELVLACRDLERLWVFFVTIFTEIIFDENCIIVLTVHKFFVQTFLIALCAHYGANLYLLRALAVHERLDEPPGARSLPWLDLWWRRIHGHVLLLNEELEILYLARLQIACIADILLESDNLVGRFDLFRLAWRCDSGRRL